jgi:hypothetical protein
LLLTKSADRWLLSLSVSDDLGVGTALKTAEAVVTVITQKKALHPMEKLAPNWDRCVITTAASPKKIGVKIAPTPK